MEQIKDLGLLIAETERAANMFGMLTRLPRVLEIIMKAQNMPAELKKEVKGLEMELIGLESKIQDGVHDLDQLKESIASAQVDFNHVAGEIGQKKSKLIDLMDGEVAAARKKANDAMQESSQKLNDRLEKNEATIKESEDKMVEAINFHREQIEVHKEQEKLAKKAVDEYKALLEKIKSI